MRVAVIVSFLVMNSVSGIVGPRDSTALNTPFQCEFLVSQGPVAYTVDPVEQTKSVSTFYDYYSASAHTPYVEAYASALYLYYDTSGSHLYLVFHFNIDDGGTPDAETTVGLQGIPAGASVAVSDDPGAGAAAEFYAGRYPQGQFHYFLNTDGGALGPLPTSTSWSMKADISHFGADPVQSQHWVDGDGSQFGLAMTGQITIASVCNSPPVVNGGGPYSGFEGSPITFNASGSSDPNGDPLTYTWDFENDGMDDLTTASPIVQHTYLDDFLGKAKLKVSDGSLSDSTTVAVTVGNVAPTATLDSVSPATEGGSVLLAFRVYDPGNDTVDVAVDWQDGLPPESLGTLTNPKDAVVQASHVYGDDGTFSLMITATDDDGGQGILQGVMAVVSNDPPTILTLSFPATTDEGSTVFFSASARDPGSDDLSFNVDFGNGQTDSSITFNNGASPDPDPSPLGTYPFTTSCSFSTLYPQNGVYGGKLSVSDDDGGSVEMQFSIEILNVAPTIMPFGPAQSDEGQAGSVTATATDPGSDDLTFLWEFELGPTVSETFQSAGSPMTATGTASYLYGDDGSYVLKLTVTDQDGASTTYETTVEVANLPPSASITQVNRTGAFTLRVAGEKWHDVIGIFYMGGTEIATLRIVREPGSPDEQSKSTGEIELPLSANFTATILYTPEDDPVNGQLNGANPVWVILSSGGNESARIHHTFNVNHNETYVWDVNLTPYVARLAVMFTATAMDPGSDDLTFTWDWGDGTPANATMYHNDGISPDPHPSPGGIFPFTATDTQIHAYTTAGTYTVTLTVSDDDGGVAVVRFIAHLD